MKKWFLKNKKADFKQISKRYKINEVIARLIVNRNIKEDNIRRYLYPSLDDMYNPFSMKDMEKGVQILKDKIETKERILIVGDYDVDGIISTYILKEGLKKCGANISYEVPDRVKDGYGINISIIDKAYENGFRTILTCDNGIAAIEQIKHAKDLGMTVVVTDHHDIAKKEDDGNIVEILPEADAVINPHQKECTYPYENICGAGVAYKLLQAIMPEYGYSDYEIQEYIQYVAIATVCDVVELKDENRIIVKNGLEVLPNTDNIGLQELIQVNGLQGDISTYHLGFVIGPCLNASGRLDTAKKAISLLSCSDRTEANLMAIELKELNDQRKDMTQENLEEAIRVIEQSDIINDMVLVVYLPQCHESLAGIIAGRIREKYFKPTIVLTKGENIAKGSCRSIEGYNIFEELQKCDSLLSKYGGHPMAAGLSLLEENIDIFRKMLNDNCLLTEEDIIPKVSIDVCLPLGYVTENLVNELKLIEPCGKDNEKPVFAEKDIIVNRIRKLGKNKNVLKLSITNQYNKTLDAMFFGNVEEFEGYIIDKYTEDELNKAYSGVINDIRLSLIYYPNINEYNGMKTLQITIQDYQ